MGEVRWVKLYTDMFDNKKIKQIKQMPEGKAILLVWVQLIVLAGSINDAGAIYFTKEIAFTDEMLATQFDEKLDVIRGALAIFRKFGMIEVVDNIIYLANWEKYQNVDGMERIKEQNRLRQIAFREKQKELKNNITLCNVTHNVDITECNGIEEDKEKEEDKIRKEKSIKTTSSSTDIDLQPLLHYWNERSFLTDITAITDKRRKMLTARIKEHGIDALYKAIDNVGKSAFLRGQNDKSWIATFDWVFLPNNFVKVLEGNYLVSEKTKEKTMEEKLAEVNKELAEKGWLVR